MCVGCCISALLRIDFLLPVDKSDFDKGSSGEARGAKHKALWPRCIQSPSQAHDGGLVDHSLPEPISRLGSVPFFAMNTSPTGAALGGNALMAARPEKIAPKCRFRGTSFVIDVSEGICRRSRCPTRPEGCSHLGRWLAVANTESKRDEDDPIGSAHERA